MPPVGGSSCQGSGGPAVEGNLSQGLGKVSKYSSLQAQAKEIMVASINLAFDWMLCDLRFYGNNEVG
jgi:hypothetical protein